MQNKNFHLLSYIKQKKALNNSKEMIEEQVLQSNYSS